MRDNWISNRIFTSYNDIVDHCCFAWNNLVDQPWRVMSLGLGLMGSDQRPLVSVTDSAAYAHAILDRLVNNAYRLNLEGHSM